MLAAHAEADVVFRQQYPAKALPEFRLVIADPEKLGKSEIGERRIARQLNDLPFAQLGIQPVALRLRSLIAPDECRAKDLVFLVQQNGSMHLARQPGTDDVCVGDTRQRRTNCRPGRFPPVMRILLSPPGARRSEGQMLTSC